MPSDKTSTVVRRPVRLDMFGSNRRLASQDVTQKGPFESSVELRELNEQLNRAASSDMPERLVSILTNNHPKTCVEKMPCYPLLVQPSFWAYGGRP